MRTATPASTRSKNHTAFAFDDEVGDFDAAIRS